MTIDKKYYTPKFSVESEITNRLIYLEDIYSKVRTEYDKMPEGSLLVACGTRDTNFRYYLREKTSDKMGVYLHADQEMTKKKYATKKYYKELLVRIESEIKMLKKIQNNYVDDSIIEAYKKMKPAIVKLIEPLNIDDKTFISMWESENYEGLGFDENDTTRFYSDKDERMRSKSELLIANALIARNIPYKYECPLHLPNGKSLYPDFTILDVKNRKVKYWEHLGKMGDMSYVAKNMWKLEEYNKLDIGLGINLFVTYENGINSLGTKDILRTIEAIDID